MVRGDSIAGGVSRGCSEAEEGRAATGVVELHSRGQASALRPGVVDVKASTLKTEAHEVAGEEGVRLEGATGAVVEEEADGGKRGEVGGRGPLESEGVVDGLSARFDALPVELPHDVAYVVGSPGVAVEPEVEGGGVRDVECVGDPEGAVPPAALDGGGAFIGEDPGADGAEGGTESRAD
jgi:hypothetical protein